MKIDERELILECKEVLLQLDDRINKNCYNSREVDCECTMCKINKYLSEDKQQKLF